MISKGVSDLRGVRCLTTRPGPITESSGLLKLHQLATEKENLLKKLALIQGQKDQTEKRLAEIARAMSTVEQAVREKARKQPTSTSHAAYSGAFIKY
jgi:septal ring factor EnvC (AmiA/AmiB activator)